MEADLRCSPEVPRRQVHVAAPILRPELGLLGLATDPIALALGWGFALPLLLIGVPVRAILVSNGLRRSQ
jgi:hypothetical protein